MSEQLQEGYPDDEDTILDQATNPVEAVFQAVGAASMCWGNVEAAGVFQEHEAIKVANDLIEFLKENPF